MAAGERGMASAHLCMTIIGIGYLFPISAIWAAFDYWKELFPAANIEFEVTAIYQAGSMLTVAALSLGRSMSMGPRIYGGFSGQFLTLASIFAFRWIVLPRVVLLHLLMILVALCSVATGYLDSALLALCSQYSPEMQRSLQIGIGFGTLVSVIYRDGTKLLMPGDIANSSSTYFIVALLTVLVCTMCYRILMRLPISRGKGGNEESLLTSPPSPPPQKVVTFSPISPGSPNDKDICAAEKGRKDVAGTGDVGFSTVWSLVWKNQLAVFLNLVLTTLCYPGLITSIPCRQYVELRADHWFQTLLLTAFTLSDIVGRFTTRFRFGLYYKNIMLTVLLRSAIFPVIMFCITSPASGDALSFAIVACFGFMNGYCVSLSLIVAIEVPELTNEQRKTGGRISACSVNSGLCVGSLLAALVASTLSIGSA